ncbi:hypothetical protein HZS_672 [Henneguya salminicola]|nr:hypothetical protein HZS_672 [Henneguya salminicola]
MEIESELLNPNSCNLDKSKIKNFRADIYELNSEKQDDGSFLSLMCKIDSKATQYYEALGGCGNRSFIR